MASIPLINFQNLRVLSLDAMNTLIKFREPVGVVYAKLFEQAGLHQQVEESTSVNPELLEQKFRTEFRHLERDRPCYAFNDGGFESWWAELIRRTFAGANPNLTLPQSFFRTMIDYYRTEQAWELVHPNIPADLRRFAEARPDLPIVITSNFDSRLRQIFDHLDLHQFIDQYFLSGELGCQKPERGIFQRIVDHYRLQEGMEQILHVGDSPDRDFVACRYGVQTLLYHPEDEMDKETDIFGRKNQFRVAPEYRIGSLSELFSTIQQS